jgi:D-alanyl-D-alanine carboxypeptidase
LFTPGGKYYNASIFPAGRKPGEYFHYSNLGFVIVGTIIEAVSQQRFDIYMRENILGYIS